MLIKFGIPLIAAVSLGFGVATTIILQPEDQLSAAPYPPAMTTLTSDAVAGLGEFQSPGEPIAVGAPIGGIVKSIHVVSGDSVMQGQVLFTLDDRDVVAELNLRRQMLAAAEARLKRLEAGTRPEELLSARARVKASEVAVEKSRDLLARAQKLGIKGAISQEEERSRAFTLRLVEAELAEAQAVLSKFEAGTWQPDIVIAERERDQVRSEVERVQTELDRLTIRAPVDAIVLRADVQPGESVGIGESMSPPIVLARSGGLEVRVQIDEEDASRVLPGAPAEGFVRGRERTRVELRFLRIEPRVVPKTSITGASTERVDTRVLFVVYAVVGNPNRVYTGQKLDVFIKADNASEMVRPVVGGI